MKKKIKDFMRKSSKASHTIRVLAGGYLLYTAYCLFKDMEGGNPLIVIPAGVIFVLFGAFFLITSLIALQNGYTSDCFATEEDELRAKAELSGEVFDDVEALPVDTEDEAVLK